MTKITFECLGGMLPRNLNLTLYLDFMPPRDALNLIWMIQKANFFSLPRNLIKHPEPEKILYSITVEDEYQRHRVIANENSTPSALESLVNELSIRLARQQSLNCWQIN